jgi:hypothetical protein
LFAWVRALFSWIEPLKQFFFIGQGHRSCARKWNPENFPPGPHVVVGWFPRNWSIPVEAYISLTKEIKKGSIYEAVRTEQQILKGTDTLWDKERSITLPGVNTVFYVQEIYTADGTEQRVFQDLEGGDVFWTIRKAVWALRGWRQWFTLSELRWFGLYEVCSSTTSP